MMKFILILSLLIFSSCSSKRPVSETSFKLSLGAFLSDSQFEGGVLVRAIELDKGVVSDHSLINNRSLEFENGRWQFLVVAFESTDLLTALCASSAPISLEGGNVTVSLNLSQAACLSAPFDTLAEEIKFDYFIKPPTAPLNLVKIYNGSSIDLTWATPTTNGGDPIVNYTIEVSVNGGAWTLLTSTAGLTYSDTSFTFGELYRYRVAAANNKAQGDYSNIVEQLATEPPTQAVFTTPTNPTFTAGQCEIVTVQTVDSSLNPSEVFADTAFTITVGGFSSYSDPTCSTPEAVITLATGQDEFSFYISGVTAGIDSLGVSSSLGSLVDNIEILHASPQLLGILPNLAGSYLQGETITIQANVYDVYGNHATSYNDMATFTFSSDPTGSATITEIVPTQFVGGSLNAQLSIDNPGANYQLTLNTPGPMPDQTSFFDINPSCDPLNNPFGNSGASQGTAANPYTLCDTAHIVSLADPIYFDKHVVMMSSIDFTGSDFIGTGPVIPNFEGVFDGAGFSIDNISIQDNLYDGYFGFFGTLLPSGQVKDLTFNNVTIFASGSSSAAALAGMAENTSLISNVKIIGGSVTGMTIVGGLVGLAKGQITQSLTNVSIETASASFSYAGGFVASVESTGVISECASLGNVNSEDANAIGGFAASISGTISNSYALGNVTGVNILDAGGFVGNMSIIGTPTIENSYSYGSVENTATYAGSFVGRRQSGTIFSSFANIETSGVGALVGAAGDDTGIIGQLTADFSDQLIFETEGWVFPGVWSLVGARPVLSWE